MHPTGRTRAPAVMAHVSRWVSVPLAIGLAIVGSVLAPGSVNAGVATAPGSSCELPVGDQDLGGADGALVVMVDGTTSSADQPDRMDSLAHLLDAATADEKLVVSVGSFGGSDAEVRFAPCLDGVLFVSDGNNARTRERNRPDLLDAADEQLVGLPSGYETSDPTSALRAGVRRLSEATSDGDTFSRTLVVHTDGIPTTGCAALPTEVDPTQPGLIDSLVQACVDAGRLPDAAGVDVVVAGVGRTDQDLSADAVTFLIDLNTSLCEASGASSCHVDPNLPSDLQ